MKGPDIVVHKHRMSHADPFLAAFCRGLERHGQAYRMGSASVPEPCDLAVFWGHRRGDIIARQQAAGARYLVVERGYIGDRFQWTSLGYDGLNGRAAFMVPEDRGDRFARHHMTLLHPWRGFDPNGPVAIMGQVRGDASVAHVDLVAWYGQAIGDARQATNRDIVFRPHPGDVHGINDANANMLGVPLQRGELAELLGAAGWVVTYNSNSAVDALLAGVPVLVYDQGGMAAKLPGTWPAYGTPDDGTQRDNRMDWLEWLAWCQWLPEEMESGDAWAQLKRAWE